MKTDLAEETVGYCGSDLPRPTNDFDVLRSDLETFGYGMIEHALDDDLLVAIQERLFEQAAAERQLHNLKNPANTDSVNQWVGMLLNKGDVFFELIRHPLATALVAEVLGPHYLVSCVDAQIQHPGSGAMPLHTDQWWMPQPVPEGEVYIQPSEMVRAQGTALDPLARAQAVSASMAANVMWMVTDFTEDNGATRIVPRSHVSGAQPDASVPHKVDTIAACGPAGTAMVFDARLWHGASANQTGEGRYGITTTFCAPQCRPLENYTRGLRPEVFEACSEETLTRLGFSAWSSYGHTGDPDAKVSAPGSETLGVLKP